MTTSALKQNQTMSWLSKVDPGVPVTVTCGHSLIPIVGQYSLRESWARTDALGSHGERRYSPLEHFDGYKGDAKRNCPGACTAFRRGIPAAAQGMAWKMGGQSQLQTQECLRGQWFALVMEIQNWSLCSALGILGCLGQTASLGFLHCTTACPYFKGLLQV